MLALAAVQLNGYCEGGRQQLQFSAGSKASCTQPQLGSSEGERHQYSRVPASSRVAAQTCAAYTVMLAVHL
jgi:hypothetical protein